MTALCAACGHPGAYHWPGSSPMCQGTSYDADYGHYQCMCFVFERDADG